jgi:uncharacterized protein
MATTGQFVWRDMMAPDAEKAQAFYTELFGWTVTSMDGDYGIYRILANNGVDFGGIGQLDVEGVPTHWVSYISTPSVDDTTAKASELGATVAVPPMDIPHVGRFSSLIDPQGASIATFTALPEWNQPDTTQIPPSGGVTWNELISEDVEGSKTFYSELFGYTPKIQDMGTGPYTILYVGDAMVAGILERPAEMPPITAWFIYFHAPDLDKALADVSRLGGQLFGEIIPIPGIGRVCMVSDSQGGVFGLHEPAPM